MATVKGIVNSACGDDSGEHGFGIKGPPKKQREQL